MKRILLAFALVGIPSAVLAQPPLKFETEVRPLLKAHCFECHGEGKKLRGGLDLRLKHLLATGGDSGAGMVPGKPGESLVVRRVRSGEMPPGKKKLTAKEIETLERWIAEGAAVSRAEPKDLPLGFSVSPEEASHWAYQPIRAAKPPAVKATNRVRNPIDGFLLAKLEEKGLGFSSEADRIVLIRRATFDLHGLPPTIEEVEAFLKDESPDAYEKLIDRLLASPRYGERWGRHWLDVAGYADSEGFTAQDPLRKHAYKYRDYVLRAFNADMPWDRFLQEQIAGDELVKPPYEKAAGEDLDKLIATGFLRNAPDGTASPGANLKEASNQTVADTLQIVSTAVLGLTVHCAQCHHHRYDPISQVDYYRMRAVFEPALNPKAWRNPSARLITLFKDEDRTKADEIEKEAAKIDQERLAKEKEFIEATFQKELAKLPAEMHETIRIARNTPDAKRTPEQKTLLKTHPSVNVSSGSLYLYDSKAAKVLKEFTEKATKLRATKPTPDFVCAVTEVPGQKTTTHLFDRGDPDQPKEAIEPAGLSIFEPAGIGRLTPKDGAIPTSGYRLAFARSLTDGKHPLPARVLMNRVWHHHFGRGIVASLGDLGILGDRPTHPELLDWLAADFMSNGWRLKRMHKLMMTSSAYRQLSLRRPEQDRIDPDNYLVGRMPVRRLEAEAVRDAILAVSGKLNLKEFGPAVPVTHDDVGQVVIGNDIRNPGDGTPLGKVKSLGGEEYRRSVYVQVRRSLPLAMLESFDAPIVNPNCEKRNISTAATQSLMLLNSGFIHEQAGHFLDRMKKEAGDDPAQRIVRAWKLAFATTPTSAEVEGSVAFVRRQTEQFANQKIAEPETKAWTNFAQALLTANRFLYVD
jgi:mono/diheme cytochrome c family protein